MRLEDHPTVKWYRDKVQSNDVSDRPVKMEVERLREICLKAGADDAGFVEIERAGIADQRDDLVEAFPGVKTVVGLVYRLNREDLRSTKHSVANLEFRDTMTRANRAGGRIVAGLQDQGIKALNPPVGFPYESDQWPGKIWFTCDKPLAEEAGLGRMGWNRLVIHPGFGDCVVIGTILVDVELDRYSSPIRFNPCIECKLCVSVCPVGAIGKDGNFNFLSCYAHNYRERLSGFGDWVERVVVSKSVADYRKRVSDSETISMWQNLSVGAQTKCDKCMAVCPAGELAIGEFLSDRKRYTRQVMKRLRDKTETIYVVPGSDAEAHVTKRFPGKTKKQASIGLRPASASEFLTSLPLLFQREQSEGLDATFHFTFTGDESLVGAAIIRNKTVEVHEEHVGNPDVHVIADSRTWLDFLAKEKSQFRAIVTRKIRVKGSPKLMGNFAKCFPA